MIEVINIIINKHDDVIPENNINIVELFNQLKPLFEELIEIASKKNLLISDLTNTDLILLNVNIENIKEKYNILTRNKINNNTTDDINNITHCEFEGHCKKCDNTNNIICENCDICHIFRKEQKKISIKILENIIMNIF